ncbi:MAG: ABC transporter ATP-binding protein [Erysipelotrichaceae bacterium]|nr:ABC transporter ATP-binding protein [Erysipelotrichaceae bacterium]
MKHSLVANNLGSGYNGTIIIDDINMSIPSNKISVIIGANACGKSTLLKNFARLINNIKGNILLDGKKYSEYSSKNLAQIIGLLPQTPYVLEGIKVYDLISRGRFPYQKFLNGLNGDDFKAIDEAMEIMNIKDIAECNVDELSGGQRQRVWIAMALAQQTDILFLDEPTTYLDITHQIEILDLLTELNRKRKTTIVMVLHDINLAIRYADYMYALKNGRIVKEGIPNEIVDEGLIKTVFDLNCLVISDPLTNKKMIVPKGKFYIK